MLLSTLRVATHLNISVQSQSHDKQLLDHVINDRLITQSVFGVVGTCISNVRLGACITHHAPAHAHDRITRCTDHHTWSYLLHVARIHSLTHPLTYTLTDSLSHARAHTFPERLVLQILSRLKRSHWNGRHLREGTHMNGSRDIQNFVYGDMWHGLTQSGMHGHFTYTFVIYKCCLI